MLLRCPPSVRFAAARRSCTQPSQSLPRASGWGRRDFWGEEPEPRGRAELEREAQPSSREDVGEYAVDEEDEEWEAEESEGAPDLTPLSRSEHESLLPVAATGPQYAYYFGGFDSALQRFFASLLGGLLASNLPLVAVPAGLYWLWAPVALAAKRNVPLRRFACAGMWHARVLQAETLGSTVFDAQGDAFVTRKRAGSVTRVLLGDDSGARLLLEVPLQPEHRNVRVGDAAELMVLSDEPGLQRFRALREAYLPEQGIWLCEYPFVERRKMEALSDALAIERSTQQA